MGYDEIIVFEPLTEAELLQIVELMVQDVAARLAERGITLLLSDAAKQALVAEGYDGCHSSDTNGGSRRLPCTTPTTSTRFRSGM